MVVAHGGLSPEEQRVIERWIEVLREEIDLESVWLFDVDLAREARATQEPREAVDYAAARVSRDEGRGSSRSHNGSSPPSKRCFGPRRRHRRSRPLPTDAKPGVDLAGVPPAFPQREQRLRSRLAAL
jgi:hypothetical protein